MESKPGFFHGDTRSLYDLARAWHLGAARPREPLAPGLEPPADTRESAVTPTADTRGRHPSSSGSSERMF